MCEREREISNAHHNWHTIREFKVNLKSYALLSYVTLSIRAENNIVMDIAANI